MVEIPRIVLHNDQVEALAERLSEAFPDAPFDVCTSYAGLPDALASFRPEVVYSVRFAGTQGFPRDAILGSFGPRWIANGGVGTDHLGVWDTRHVTVTNAAGVAANMMAEYILGGILHFTLGVADLQADKADKAWRSRRVTPIGGKTLAIVGLGHTGQALAMRAKALGMTVLGTRARPVPMDNVDDVAAPSGLHQVLARADFVAVCTPLTAHTRGMIGAPEIASMKPGVIFADVSRGGVVDQTALIQGLRDGPVAAAVLDVFETEPLPPESPFWDLPNVILSPHCSSVYDGWEMASFDMFLSNLRRWIDAAPLENVVDPDRGY
ncbi:MAG: D-2-hydroxyacid dehydrogenase [Pseudomonadota bacterium]